MKKFWNFIRNDAGERILRLEGPIDEDSFWGDEVTPAAFRDELEADEGDVTVWINSPGGNVFAAAEIYTMLKDHKGKITVKIDAIAASAASVIAMAGDTVLISPTGMYMVHDPMTIAYGNTGDMEKAITTLNEVKESIINAYVAKTGLSRNKVAKLMSDETWMNARKAVEYGFADGILFTEEKGEKSDVKEEAQDCWQPFSTKIMGQAILNQLGCIKDEASEISTVHQETEEHAETGMSEMIPSADESATVENAPEASGEETNDAEECGGTEDEESGEKPPVSDSDAQTTDTRRKMLEDPSPIIGMDGKTKDGAMPYEILKEKLEWLK